MLAERVEAHGPKYRAAMSDAQLDTIGVAREGGVVTVTLDRPHRKNAIDATMWDELLVTFREIAQSDEDRVLVVTGAGGEFCSGADLSPSGEDDRHHLARMRYLNQVCLALHHLPQPTIAKVRGIAAGAGLNLALGCDLVVAADGARFSEIFARRGLSIDFGGSWVLPRRIGLHKAKELALLADIIDAPIAAAMGLVNQVVPEIELDATVDEWATRLAAGPPIALALTKSMLDNAFAVTLEQALEDEARAQSINFGTEDTFEAISAFLTKRDPTFKGR
ncbi:enoyl-CoA hydratase [soil metagenome]